MENKTKYHPRELLLVEVESDSSGVIIGSKVADKAYLANCGKNEFQVFGADLELFERMVEDASDEWNRALANFNRNLNVALERAKKDYGSQFEDEKPLIVKRERAKKGPSRLFRDAMQRDPKPFRSVVVTKSLGIQKTEKELIEENAKRADAERGEQTKLLLETIKQLTPQKASDDEVSKLRAELEELKALLKKK